MHTHNSTNKYVRNIHIYKHIFIDMYNGDQTQKNTSKTPYTRE